MDTPRIDLSREQTAAVAIITVLVSVGVVWLMVSIVGNDTSPPSTTPTTEPAPTDTTTTVLETTTTSLETTTTSLETTTTSLETTTTSGPDPTTTVGVFDEVAAVEAFIEEFSGAIEAADSAFLFESLHPAVKATYEEAVCMAHIEDRVLSLDDYRREGPVIGPFDAEFGDFPITSYEARVRFEIGGDTSEETAVFSLTEGVVRWFAECS